MPRFTPTRVAWCAGAWITVALVGAGCSSSKAKADFEVKPIHPAAGSEFTVAYETNPVRGRGLDYLLYTRRDGKWVLSYYLSPTIPGTPASVVRAGGADHAVNGLLRTTPSDNLLLPADVRSPVRLCNDAAKERCVTITLAES